MLTLTYKAKTSVPVEVEGLSPCALREKSLAEIERLEVFHGNQAQPLAELFSISGTTTDGRLEFIGDLSGVHGIGSRMQDGEIHVQGNAGRHVGSEMAGGQIHVHGNTGDWLGAEMRHGLIHVQGNAGDLVGSAYRGGKRGMTGGTILVGGNAGDEVGHTMRRGMIVIGGTCGDFVGLNMIAGTILVFGQCGNRPAAGMRRGTIGLFGPGPASILGTFRQGCLYRPPFLPLIFRQLRALNFGIPAELGRSDYRLFHGDNVAIGRGELLVREARVS